MKTFNFPNRFQLNFTVDSDLVMIRVSNFFLFFAFWLDKLATMCYGGCRQVTEVILIDDAIKEKKKIEGKIIFFF